MQYTELNATLRNNGEVVAVSSINLIQMDSAGQHVLAMVPEGENPDAGNTYQLTINWKPTETQ